MSDGSRYAKRGVSSSKKDVHRAIKNLDQGIFPNAFCKILPDITGGSAEYCNIMHADTAGTKTSLAYLYWRETGSLEVWEGIAQDALVMNLDDMACAGCTTDIVISSTIGRNGHLITGDVIEALIQGGHAFVDRLESYDIDLHMAGGETADVGDIVRTVDVGYTTFARMQREEVIDIDIQAGDVIVGFGSFGQADYEKFENSGIGSNGLTSARHDLLHNDYGQRYPESVDPNTPDNMVYTGPHHLTDKIEGLEVELGRYLLSPTRTYLPLLEKVFRDPGRSAIHGLIHCTGGGQTKVLKFVEGVEIIKDRMFESPKIFEMIQKASGTDWREMYQVFNMGHRLEAYVDEQDADSLISAAESLGIPAKIIGSVRSSDETRLLIHRGEETYSY